MRLSRFTISVAFALFGLLAPAFAQTGAIHVTIPFNFTVGVQTFPAGEYKVAINGSLLRVARIDGPGIATVLTNFTGGGPGQNAAPRLLFHRYGNRYFLSVAWIGEIEQGHDLFASPKELELARTTKLEQKVVLASLSK